MFKAQLRAIYRASAYGNISLMYPMITSEEELDEIEELIREVKKGLDEKNIPYKDIRTGIMIETGSCNDQRGSWKTCGFPQPWNQ